MVKIPYSLQEPLESKLNLIIVPLRLLRRVFFFFWPQPSRFASIRNNFLEIKRNDNFRKPELHLSVILYTFEYRMLGRQQEVFRNCCW